MTSSMNGSVLTPLRRESSSCISDLKATSKCLRLHLNSLWSIWYGICIAAFNGYIVLECAKRYFDYEDLRLASNEKASNNELNVCIALTGVSVLFLPFFLSSAIFKVGNLANDGFKLGRNLNACSADPPAGVTVFAKNGCQRLWQHCGPAASLFHLIMAFCVLIPKLIMEARLIQMNVLSKDSIWKTDLDFLVPHHDRSLMTFNFTSPIQSGTVLAVNNSNLETTTTSTTVATPSSVTAVHTTHPKNAAFIAAASYEILFEDNINISSVSIEYMNYAVALLIYSIRYPSVFWGTNKYFGILFSVQLLINGVQCLLLHSGISILYKIHVMGTREQLPYLFVLANKFLLHFGKPFILNKEVTLTLYVMSTVLVLISSLVLYLYGYGRLNSFLHREQARRIISMRDLQSGRSWGYFTHCVALCVLVAIAVCEAPLLYDLSVVYRGSLDSLVLVVILSSILHLFVWVLLWLILTLKQHWEFKLRVTVGQAAVRSARSIKLVTDVHLVSSMADHANAPLLVVGHGKTYTVSDGQAKRSIMAVIQKANMDKKIKAGHINNTKNVADDIDEQIYWLRPKSRTPRCSPDSSSSENRFGWFTKRRVTTNRNGLEEITALTGKYTSKKYIGGTNDDDGDYVRLREIPMTDMNASTSRTEHSSDDTTSEDNKLLESVRNDTVTYASVNKEHLNPSIREFDDPSPLLTPEPEDHDDLPPPPPELSVGFVSPTKTEHHQDLGKCLQRTDSGMPTEELPSRSDSEVSGGSPPDKTCSNSETSSGVHSNSSRESCTNNRNFDQPVNIFNESMQKIAPQQWMQRNSVIQSSGTGSAGTLSSSASPIYGTASAVGPSIATTTGFNRVYKPQQHYAAVANKTPSISEVGEDSATVVIMRKPNNHLYHPAKPVAEDPIGRFDRSTNMHLSSFTDRHPTSDAVKTAASATLPHYPTQPPIGGATPYSHCSTMPILNSGSPNCAIIGNGGSCGSFPRPHTTIPVHHNGVRFSHHHMMINGVAGNGPPYAASKRILPVSAQPQNYPLSSGNSGAIVYKPPSHHTFPQVPMHHQLPATKYYLQANNAGSERDSANFSIASSGADSADGCHSNSTSSATVTSS